jgi:hypothetical protein
LKWPLKRIAGWLTLLRQVQWVARLTPRKSWYRAALVACKIQGILVSWFGGNRLLTEAVMLDHWLVELTRIAPFPIPWTITGAEVIGADPTRPILYCWIHEPLAEFPLRPLLERGFAEPVVVADPGRITANGQLLVAGMPQRLTTITANLHALARVRKYLQEGVPVACLADAKMGGPLYSLALRLVGRIGARVIFLWAKRRADGTIDVTFAHAPRPYCETKEAVQENLAYLHEAQTRMLKSLGQQPQLLQPQLESDFLSERGQRFSQRKTR